MQNPQFAKDQALAHKANRTAVSEDPTTYFNDGVRKIDFVLVYEENRNDYELDETTAMEGEEMFTSDNFNKWVYH